MIEEEIAGHEVRDLAVAYESDPGIWEPVACGFTHDAQLTEMFEYFSSQQSDAWLLFTLEKLPKWWRLVYSVKASGYTDGTVKLNQPMVDAALRWENASRKEQRTLAHGWRIIRTRHGGRIVRMLHQQEDIVIVDQELEQSMDIVAIINGLSPKVAGPYSRVHSRLLVPVGLIY